MFHQNKSFGHVRSDHEDPVRQMTIDSNLHLPGVFSRRVGRPRVGWVKGNARWLHEKENPDGNYDHENDELWT